MHRTAASRSTWLVVCSTIVCGCGDLSTTPPSQVARQTSTTTAGPAGQTDLTPVVANARGTLIIDVGPAVTVLDATGPLPVIAALQVMPAAPDALTQPGRISLEVLLRYRFLRQRDDLSLGAQDWLVTADVARMPVQAPAAMPWLGAHAAGQGVGREAGGWVRVDAPVTGPVQLVYSPTQPGDPILASFAIQLRER